MTMLRGNFHSAKREALVEHVNWALTKRARDKVHGDLTSKTVRKGGPKCEAKRAKRAGSCQSGTQAKEGAGRGEGGGGRNEEGGEGAGGGARPWPPQSSLANARTNSS